MSKIKIIVKGSQMWGKYIKSSKDCSLLLNFSKELRKNYETSSIGFSAIKCDINKCKEFTLESLPFSQSINSQTETEIKKAFFRSLENSDKEIINNLYQIRFERSA